VGWTLRDGTLRSKTCPRIEPRLRGPLARIGRPPAAFAGPSVAGCTPVTCHPMSIQSDVVTIDEEGPLLLRTA